jgi:hypothetical protein
MEYLIIGGIGGTVCACIAGAKGRSVIAWFFIGFLAPLIGLIIILVVSNLKEEQRYREHAAAERRRLHEQLRQERMKNETFRQHSVQRLDAHDKALGLDTRAATALGGGAGDDAAALPAGAPPRAGRARTTWYYEHGGKSRGPVPTARVVELLRSGTLSPEALVWSEGDADWRPASKVDELRGGFAS